MRGNTKFDGSFWESAVAEEDAQSGLGVGPLVDNDVPGECFDATDAQARNVRD